MMASTGVLSTTSSEKCARTHTNTHIHKGHPQRHIQTAAETNIQPQKQTHIIMMMMMMTITIMITM